MKDKPLIEKLRFRGRYYLIEDVKEAIKKAEDFIISMKRDDDKVWNMRLNLIIEEFRTKIFGEFK
ncbi:MAG TPA: hypothetical protein VMZ91_00055 [Candidatus Paceibacterota bacterium]|nr:hypothetical protein [Candidatus Paceibacterota bacterium]